MNVLVFNCGSSSLKYKLISMPDERALAYGEAQRISPRTAVPSQIIHHVGAAKSVIVVPMPDHAAAFDQVMLLLSADPRLVPDAFGHRLVHGGSLFSAPTILDSAVLERLASIQHLAPLHNPPAMSLIRACLSRRPDLPEVAVFDTAFHATIPDYASTYALPKNLREDLGIRKYGFHGTSHRFVIQEAARLLKTPLGQFSAVSCHLGSGGSSLCAVVNGSSVDNTMGFSPLQGLVMSTRCGDLDPALTMRLLARSSDPRSVEKLLNEKSGVLGLSGISSDIRDVFARINSDDSPRLASTAQVYLWRMRKYLGAYLAVVGSLNAVIFTDTIGELVPFVRWTVCAGLQCFGLDIDPALNDSVKDLPADVATPASPVRILVIATNEELAIARETYATLAHAPVSL